MKSMWIVNEDVLEDAKVNIQSADYDENEAKSMECTPFKMYDDDNELYYKGFFYGDAESEDGFRPLDEYGMPNAGCASIYYLNKATGIYEEL